MPVLDAVFCALLAIVTVTDLERRIIPNRVLAAGAVVALAIVAWADPTGLPERLGAAAAAGGALLAVSFAFPHGLGMGDAKLVAVMGLYLGWAVAPAALVGFGSGALAGAALIARHGSAARNRAIPLAPFLALGGLVGLSAGPAIVRWYLTSLLAVH
jgi:leader peptidase (prepilin peptidase) / N-methyltransferase